MNTDKMVLARGSRKGSGVKRLWRGLKSEELRWLASSLRGYWSRYLGAVFAAVLTSAMGLVDPLVLGWVIDAFLKSHSTSIPLIGASVVLVAYEIRLWLSAFAQTWAADTYQGLVLNLRLRVLEHFDCLSLDYHETTSLGAKSFIFLESVDNIAVIGAEVIPLLVRSIITGVVAFVTMAVLSPRLSLVLLSALPLYLLATRHFKRQIRAATDAANNALDRMSQYVHEHLAVVPQIQILTQEAREIGKASQLLGQVRGCQRGRIASEVRYTMVNGTVTAFTSALILGYGAYLAQLGAMSLGQLVICYGYLARLFEPIGNIASAYANLQKSISSVERLQQFFATKPSVASPEFPKPIRSRDIRVACHELCFSYKGGRSAVRNLTFAIGPGERISIAGRSGAGKSTAAKLIARLYDPQSGSVSINGQDIKRIDLPSVRRLIHYMPQHADLFTGTVEENLSYGNPSATSADLRRVIEIVQLEPVLRRMSRGLQETLGPRGSQISGGERQRLALGRAILQCPRVLILDEATAFLDSSLEGEVFERLRTYLPETSLVLISHRLTALDWVDRHLLLDQGTLIASGAHRYLHKESHLYRELYDTAKDQHALIEPVSIPNSSQHSLFPREKR